MSLGTDASAQGPAQGDEDTELEPGEPVGAGRARTGVSRQRADAPDITPGVCGEQDSWGEGQSLR